MTYLPDIMRYLEEQGQGTREIDLFNGSLPDIDNAILVRSTGGPEGDMYVDIPIKTFQVFVTNKSHATGEAKISTIRDLFHLKANTTLISGGLFFYYIRILSEPVDIGKDEQNRRMFSMNVELKIRKPD